MEDLGAIDRSRLAQFEQVFEAGQTVFAEGDLAERCYILQQGRIRLVKKIRATERSLTVLKPGDLLGEDALLEGARRAATAVTLSEARVLSLDRRTFGELLAGDAGVATRLVGQLVRRLRSAEEQLENAMLRDTPSRIVNTLLRVAGATLGSESPEGVVIQISPLELSSRVGLDVDSVKRSVQQLRDGGYLQITDERIVVPDVGALRRLYELLGMKEEVRGDAG